IAPRLADRDVGGAQLAGAERLQRHAALAAILPFRRIGQIVFAAEAEVGDLIGLLQPVMLHLRRAAGEGVGDCARRADQQHDQTDEATFEHVSPGHGGSLLVVFCENARNATRESFDLAQWNPRPEIEDRSDQTRQPVVAMPFLNHGSYRIRYELEGPPGAPAYVLVNGLTQYADLGTAYREALVARHFRVATFDLLGQGGSDKPALFINQDDQVTAVHRLIGELGDGPIFLSGISFGGLIALRYAIEHGKRLS